jgi:superoxide dismutase, Cu-Zn family
MPRLKSLLLLVLAPLLAAPVYAAAPAAAQGTTAGATAELRDAQGQLVGQAVLRPGAAGGVQVQVVIHGFAAAAPGAHGIHVHAVGRCEPPAFTTASGHFNPAGKQHGLNNPQGHHAGDMPNIVFDAAGNATYELTDPDLSLAAGSANSIFDPDGSAVVIHAGPDDLVTDPAGNSGARIACGVLTAAQVTGGMPRTGGADADFLNTMILLAAALLLSGVLVRRTRRAA